MENNRSIDTVRYPSPQTEQPNSLASDISTLASAHSLAPIAIPDDTAVEAQAPKPEPPRQSHHLRWILLALGIGAALLMSVSLLLANRNTRASQVASGDFDTIKLPLSDIPITSQGLINASSLKINGQLQVMDSLVIAPTITPANPTIGQLYYDKTANQLSYYNGQQFLGIGQTTINNIGGNTINNVTNATGNSPPSVLLQPSAAGTQQTGSFDISGTGHVGTLSTSVISSDGGVLYVNPVGSITQQEIAPGTPATIGLTSAAGAYGPGWNNMVSATKVTMGEIGGTTKSISVQYTSGSASSHVQLALYDDDGNIPSRPGSLVAQSAIANLVPNGTTTITIPAVSLSANTSYWLAVNTDDATVRRAYNGGNKASCFASRTFGSMADPFGGCFFDDNNYVISLNYLVGSGASGSVSPAQFSLSVTGQAVFRNSSNSTTAFQVQNASGTATLLNVDTTSGRVGIGKSTPAYRLDVAGGDVNISGGRSLRFGGSPVVSANADGTTITVSNLNAGGSISVQADNFAVQDATASHQALAINSSGNATFSNKTNSATGFQVQNALGAGILTVDTGTSTVTVTTLITTGNLTINGHLVTGGSTPGIAAGAAACTTPTVGVSGNDTSGTVTITTGTSCAAGGTLATVTFATAFSATPRITLTPGNANAQTLGAYTDNSANTTAWFTIGTSSTAADSTTYIWNYFATQ